jgi:hypothetical protein
MTSFLFFSFRFSTTEAMLPLLSCTARHWGSGGEALRISAQRELK